MTNYSTMVKNNLISIIKEMEKSPEAFVKNPGKDFSRHRKLTFECMIRFLLSMNGNTLSTELLEYFNYDIEVPTVSAFVQQRAKILPSALEYLFKAFNGTYDKQKLFMGYHCLAVDGTKLNIPHNPNDSKTYVRSSEQARGYNLLHLNALYDLKSKLYVESCLQVQKEKNETGALVDMVNRSTLAEPTLIIADRGYESYNVFAHLEEKGWKYMIRVKDKSSSSIVSTLPIPETETFDECFKLTLTRKQTKEIKANPQTYKFLPNNSRFDYFELNDTLFYPLNFRVLRFKISETSYETIITNLDTEEFSPEIIKELYHLRWGVETSFRELKYTIGLAHLHSKKMDFIVQEVLAKLIMYNFCEMITLNVALEKKDRKHEYQANFTVAIHLCKEFFRGRVMLIEELIKKHILPIREGRHYERRIRTKSLVGFMYRVA